jgi:hypothetical protein
LELLLESDEAYHRRTGRALPRLLGGRSSRRQASGDHDDPPPDHPGRRRRFSFGLERDDAATPLDGFNVGFIICGIIMLVGGTIGMALIRPEREAMQWASEMPEVAVKSA